MTERLRHATLRQLQIFIIAGETSSFARAAEALHLTQPAVSMQMAQLSEAVGVPLFEKRGRNLVLSSAGQTLLPYAQRVAQSLRDASDALDALQGRHQGKVKIALVTTTRYFAPRLIAQFHAQHPHIELDVSIANREAVITQLEAGEVDLAIMGRPPPRTAVVAEPFARHPHGVIAAPNHLLAGKKRLDPQKLAGEPFIYRENGSGTRSAMEFFFAEHQIKPPMQREMSSNESIKQAVMAGMGLAFISLHTIGLEQQTGHLVLLDVKGLPIVRTWYVLYPATKLVTPAAQTFQEFMVTEGPAFMESLFPGSSKLPRQ